MNSPNGTADLAEGVDLDVDEAEPWTPDLHTYRATGEGVHEHAGRHWFRRGQPKQGRSPLVPAAAWGNPGAATIDIAALTLKLWRVVAYGLAAVIAVPTVMSGIHLIQWAGDDVNGLGLPTALTPLPIVTLDGTTVVCIAMVTMAALRREHGGAFQIMAWVMSLISFGVNLKYGLETKPKGDEYYYPAMSITGPVIMEFTLAFLRRWLAIDAGLRFQGVAWKDFGKRLRPRVARRETKAAWRISQREGITDPWQAIRAAREERLLRGMTGPDALRIAFSRIGNRDAFEARLWLLGRGIEVTEQDAEEALRPRDLVEFVVAAEDGVTAAEVAQWKYGRAEADDVERARRLLDELVGEQLTRDSTGKGGRGKATRYRIATGVDPTEAMA